MAGTDQSESPPASGDVVTLSDVTRIYGQGVTEVRALDGIDLSVATRDFIVLLGPSGSGKTTLLNVIGGIEVATSGLVTVDGRSLGGLDTRELTAFRREHVAFIFQFYNLIPTLTAVENVELIGALTGGTRRDAERQLTSVGLGDGLDRFPSALSGGQQQRVAVARALAKDCPLLLCDEPTGALDHASGDQVLDLLEKLNREDGRTVILVTHDESIAARATRVIEMVDGRIVSDTSR